MDARCPLKVTPHRQRCPWLQDSPELENLLSERDKAYQRWRHSRVDSSRNKYRRLRNIVKKCLAKFKRSYLCDRTLTDRRGSCRNVREFALRPAKGGGGVAGRRAPVIGTG